MVLRYLLSALLQRARAVERLAGSRPVRSAARLTVHAVLRAQQAGRDAAARLLRSVAARRLRHTAAESELGRRAARLTDGLVRDVKDGAADASRQVKGRKGAGR